NPRPRTGSLDASQSDPHRSRSSRPDSKLAGKPQEAWSVGQRAGAYVSLSRNATLSADIRPSGRHGVGARTPSLHGNVSGERIQRHSGSESRSARGPGMHVLMTA